MAGPGGKPGQGYPTVMVNEGAASAFGAVHFNVYNHRLTGNVSGIVREQHGTNTNAVLLPHEASDTPAVAFSLSPGREGCGNQKKDDLYVANQNTSRTLATDCGSEPNRHQGGTVIVHPVATSDTPAVAFTENHEGRVYEHDYIGTLNQGGGKPRMCYPAIRSGVAVRRLTPTECERLMGFPDGWTAISWRNKPVSECPDGPRYKALGNSMAVNCMRFIGERIVFVDAVFSELEAASEADE
jgi:site-specific DNA-cytosine methylase